jgi:hypothetical protein
MRLPALCALAFALFTGTASSAAEITLEYRLQAVFLLDFTKFVDWPPGALGAQDSPFNICILGSNPFGGELDRVVAGEAVQGRKVAIQNISRAPAPGACQIVFVGRVGDDTDIGALGRGILTVGEGEDFVRRGGMIGFVIDNRRVTFDINWRIAGAAGLKFSSRLLGVARTVIR